MACFSARFSSFEDGDRPNPPAVDVDRIDAMEVMDTIDVTDSIESVLSGGITTPC